MKIILNDSSKEISIEQCKDLSPGSRPGIMYGLAKVQKIVTDAFDLLDPFFCSIGTLTCKLAKALFPMLESRITK